MPRISAERREVNRSQIMGAARRCFSRDGFHQTSMPDIAAEAGVSVGAPYRYFSSKEELIVEIASETFRMIFDPVERLVDAAEEVTIADLVASAVDPVSNDLAVDAAGRPIPIDELLRCAVQAWAELLSHDALRERAVAGFDHVRGRIADGLRRGQSMGVVPAGMDADAGARVVMALLHGVVLQRTAFGLAAPTSLAEDIRSVLTVAGLGRP